MFFGMKALLSCAGLSRLLSLTDVMHETWRFLVVWQVTANGGLAKVELWGVAWNSAGHCCD
jgi:hypothetical protein